MPNPLARFQRGETRITFRRDPLEPDAYQILTDSPTAHRVETFRLTLYPFHCELYLSHGYQRLLLCLACDGTGREPGREPCAACGGAGGHISSPEDSA